jgi:dTDP-4-dehydrorhamnose reductase
MRVFVTGAGGMLGRTFVRAWSDRYELVAPVRSELDLMHGTAVTEAMKVAEPDVVVHCAAYTKVDQAESAADDAFRGNAVVTAHVAAAAQRVGARLVSFSTDYVFSGELDRPYHEWDEVGPRTVYGASKAAGEAAVRVHCPDHTIVRIAWMYGAGGPSFLHSILRLARRSPTGPLSIVDDQVGNPTSCAAVVALTERLLDDPLPGVVHGTCEGGVSWYGFARSVLRLMGIDRRVEPCTTMDFPRPAPRPRNSQLDNRRLRLEGWPSMPHWQTELAQFIETHRDEFES